MDSPKAITNSRGGIVVVVAVGVKPSNPDRCPLSASRMALCTHHVPDDPGLVLAYQRDTSATLDGGAQQIDQAGDGRSVLTERSEEQIAYCPDISGSLGADLHSGNRTRAAGRQHL